jgi:hypothetical protein
MEVSQILAEIYDAAESKIGGIVGIRALHADQNPVIGETMAESYHWDDDVRSDESIGGTAVFHGRNSDAVAAAAAGYFAGPGRYAIVSGSVIVPCIMPERYAKAVKDAEVVAIIDATVSPAQIIRHPSLS